MNDEVHQAIDGEPVPGTFAAEHARAAAAARPAAEQHEGAT